MAKFLDDNGLLYFWQKIKNAFVAKETGKGLSSNDFTNADKSKLDGIDAGAEVNVIDSVKVNNAALTPDANKAVNITVTIGGADGTIAVNGSDVPVKGLGSAAFENANAFDAAGAAAAVQENVDDLELLVGAEPVADQIEDAIGELDSSIAAENNQAIASITITDGKITAHTKVAIPTNNNQLTNGAGYQTSAEVAAAIAEALSGITGISFEIVQTLPQTGENGTIYLISHGGSGSNIYDEYIYVNNAWEKIGTTDIDLTGYWNNTNLTAITNSEIDTIVAS